MIPEPAVRVAGYTRPQGKDFVVWLQGGAPRSNRSLERIDTASHRQVVLDPGGGNLDDRWSRWLYSRDGTTVYLSGKGSLRTVSNAGGKVTLLPAFASTSDICGPVRWWDDETILASCISADGYSRLWLYPLAGKPAPVTAPESKNSNGSSFGYYTAFRVGSGTYLGHGWDCGATSIAKLTHNGAGTEVSIPQALRSQSLVGVVGDDLAIRAADGCDPGGWFGFYDPVANTATKVVVDAAGDVGVVAALAFDS